MNSMIRLLAAVMLSGVVGCSYTQRNARIPPPIARDEVISLRYTSETTYKLSKRVEHRECGFVFFPLPPIGVPAQHIHKFPALVNVGASPNRAYETARTEGKADFLVDVREEWDNTVVLFIFAQQCVTVSGMAAHLER